MKKKPNILVYSDYRQFLKDYFVHKQGERGSWTYGTWSRQLKLSSPSTLTMIVKGQRHPGPKLVDALCLYFKFSTEEEVFFRDLIGLQKRVGDDSRLAVFLLKNLREKSSPRKSGELKDVLFQRASYVLREMTLLEDFEEDADWIRSRLADPMSSDEIDQLLKKLQLAGLLGRNEQGKLVPKEVTHKSAPPTREKVSELHRDLLRSTERAVDEAPEDRRVFTTSFLNIRADKIDEVKKLIDEFQDRFSQCLEQKPGKDVYQLNVHFFPATRKPRPNRQDSE